MKANIQKQHQNSEQYLWMGTIVNTHSLKGEVRLLTTGSLDNFSEKSKIFIKVEDEFVSLEIASSRKHKNFILLKFVNLDDIDKVLFLKNQKIYLERSEIDPEEIIFDELLNFEVYEEDFFVGIVVGHFNQVSYFSLEVKTASEKIINIPYIDQIIKNVDYVSKKIKINFLEGDYT